MKLFATARDLPGLIAPGELWIDQSVDAETRARIICDWQASKATQPEPQRHQRQPEPEPYSRVLLEVPPPQFNVPAQPPLDFQPLMAVVDELQRFQKEDRESLADCLKSLLKAQQEQTDAILALVQALKDQKPLEFPKAEPLDLKPLVDSLASTVGAMSKHHVLMTRELVLELTKPKVFERDDDGRITGMRHAK